MFAWIQNRIRSAVVRGVHEGLADVGLIDPDTPPDGESIRAAIADRPPESEPAARRAERREVMATLADECRKLLEAVDHPTHRDPQHWTGPINAVRKLLGELASDSRLGIPQSATCVRAANEVREMLE